MARREIQITEADLARLQKLIEDVMFSRSNDTIYLRSLQQELARAKIVKPKAISEDVITMNSTVQLKDLDTGEELIYSLVFPADADIKQGKISVLAPVGTGLLGYRVGDTVEWKVPAGTRRLRVEGLLYQPEAAGDYHL